MNSKRIRTELIQRDLNLKDVAKLAGIGYDRLVKIVNGYRRARPEEIRALAAALGVPARLLADTRPRSMLSR